MAHQRLSEHINRCLAKTDCVIIPDLGGFITEVIPAGYNAEENRAYPPQEELHFNAALTHRDGVLEAAYATTYGISQRRARIMLDEDIKSLRSDLIKAKKVLLPDIGQLSLSESGELSFGYEASSKRLHLPSYGLFPASMPRLSVEPEITLESSVKAQKKNSKYFYIPIHKATLGVTAAVLAFGAILLLPFGSTNSQDNCEAAFIPTKLVAEKLWKTADSQKATTTKNVINNEEKSLNTSTVPAAETDAQETISGIPCYKLPLQRSGYFVIIGSFKTQKQVEAFISQEKLIERRQVGILKDSNWYRIYQGEYDNEGIAYSNAVKLSKEAWVFKTKSKKG